MIYFDNAATTRFKPIAVKKAVLRELCRSANPGRGSHADSVRAGSLVEKCREEIAERLFDGRVIFTKNCTEALNLGILGVEPSGQVVTTVHEHNSVLRPLKALADAGKIRLKIIDHSSEAELINALKTPTSLVVTTAMSNVTGRGFDIGAIGRIIKARSNALFLVDMAQAAGHVGTDLKYADMCAFAGHKHLHGIQGTGFLAVRKNVSLKARIFGGTGTSSFDIKHPNTIPDGMEAGTLNTPGIAALYEGIRWTYDNLERIRSREREVCDTLLDGLKDETSVEIISCANGIFLFNIRGVSSDSTADFLDSEGIAVRSGLHCAPLIHKRLGTAPFGAVRISAGFNNGVSDAEKAVAAIKRAVTKLSPRS